MLADLCDDMELSGCPLVLAELLKMVLEDGTIRPFSERNLIEYAVVPFINGTFNLWSQSE